MEKLTKENIYIDLRGKSKEELTELYNFLESVGEKHFRETLNDFLGNYKGWIFYEFHGNMWTLSSDRFLLEEKTEVTIEQLKEMLQPMETLQEKEQRLLRDLEEVRKEIEEENKPKVGDWLIDNGVIRKVGFNKIMQGERKITNPQLIKLLENELQK